MSFAAKEFRSLLDRREFAAQGEDPEESEAEGYARLLQPFSTKKVRWWTRTLRMTGRRAAALAGLLVVLWITRNGPFIGHHDASRDVYNSTLGFQQVFAISTPGRTDKSDALALASGLVGFDITYSPGVKPDDISEKGYPPTWNASMHLATHLACWRAHMDVIKTIVERKLSTALILEDDADWSYFLKDQLFEVSRGSQALEGNFPYPADPYGTDWDLLWLGHCRIAPDPATTKFWVVENDATAPPYPARHAAWSSRRVLRETWQNSTRLLFASNTARCTFGYAVSHRGAQKILSAVSVSGSNLQIDGAYRELCMGADPDMPEFNCIGLYPPIFASHRFAGSHQKDSDINEWEDYYHDEFTWDIPYSTIMNRQRIIEGKKTLLSQTRYGLFDRPAIAQTEISVDQPRYMSKGQVKYLDYPAAPKWKYWHAKEAADGMPQWMIR